MLYARFLLNFRISSFFRRRSRRQSVVIRPQRLDNVLQKRDRERVRVRIKVIFFPWCDQCTTTTTASVCHHCDLSTIHTNSLALPVLASRVRIINLLIKNEICCVRSSPPSTSLFFSFFFRQFMSQTKRKMSTNYVNVPIGIRYLQRITGPDLHPNRLLR